ncbi:MAG: hypothetical protein EKK33_33805 [Bradyrhizobiaceae bacterium]|nr:MAG: hypothetical protein EKK33_33805 [Bradyrhizobiaceae bacterium]
MLALAILVFLSGAVFAWAFSVWILIPATLLVFTLTMISEVWQGTPFVAALGVCVGVAILPQLGYAFGLATRGALSLPRPGDAMEHKTRQRAARINDAEAR